VGKTRKRNYKKVTGADLTFYRPPPGACDLGSGLSPCAKKKKIIPAPGIGHVVEENRGMMVVKIMKMIVVGSLILVLLACTSSPIATGFPEESWEISRGVIDGNPLIVRKNRGALAYAKGSDAYSYRVMIAIGINRVDENGLPIPEASADLYQFEDKVGLTLKDTDSVIALVLTTQKMRQLFFYTAQPDKVDGVLEKMKENESGLYWGYEVVHDPDWSLYN